MQYGSAIPRNAAAAASPSARGARQTWSPHIAASAMLKEAHVPAESKSTQTAPGKGLTDSMRFSSVRAKEESRLRKRHSREDDAPGPIHIPHLERDVAPGFRFRRLRLDHDT